MAKKRKLVKLRAVVTILTTSVIVTMFVFIHSKIADDMRLHELPSHVFDNQDIRGTQRALLRFKYRRKALQDTVWFNNSLKKTNIKFSNTEDIDRELIVMKLTNKIFNTVSESTPSVTDAPTRPITTQSDTTPINTDAPTQPVTTESITTPIVTEPGEKDVTTEEPEPHN
ncbi:uncharacterized protein LOC132745788 [Ruditapes philippinarum]|uniref:uncharacterized protein LOC132745788 n=1 Tax=Ruditapes philippinarum TaxID=129788 RepID=UPI00295BE1AD|nr:uncharacterized protein LOC132745788 [Ruditapes philippinarum]XP_060590747.1 uncharacterized protein LOC132745788 [Ruditapes philippinarum]XP_060590748.1 uncharacterized protein LOC132745788 [Ruditapes philippinarum]